MGSEFTFYDFVDAGGSGENVVKAWLHGPGSKARAKFNQIIANLEGTPPPWTGLGRAWDKLKGKGFEELYEMRLEREHVQYRLIAFFGAGDREVTITMGAIHKDKNWTPSNFGSGSQHRRKLVTGNAALYRTVHDDG